MLTSKADRDSLRAGGPPVLPTAASDSPELTRDLVWRHQRIGWVLLLVFASGGLVLETLHGFKADFYLGAPLRRELWSLAHAHGVLISLLHLAFSASLACGWWASRRRAELASFLLTGAAILLPAGFLLGGLTATESDPGAGIWLVPAGAAFLAIAAAVALTARRPD